MRARTYGKGPIGSAWWCGAVGAAARCTPRCRNRPGCLRRSLCLPAGVDPELRAAEEQQGDDPDDDHEHPGPVSYTHLRAHETRHDLVCRLLLEKKKNKNNKKRQREKLL